MKLDISHTHNKNVEYNQEPTGYFCGSPIRQMYTREMELDQIVDTDRTIEINRNTPPALAVEILPGELICDDRIVRRSTTSEALGTEFYNYEVPTAARKVPLEIARKLMDEGAMITWRPNRVVSATEEFAIVHEEEEVLARG